MALYQKTILFMFLGSTPNEENLINHWIILNKDLPVNDNIFIVIHPINLNIFKIDENFKYLFNQKNIYIVNEEHHIETKWTSHSLTCATLLMIQYAHIKNNNFFNKYILLSPSCMPLYSLNEIYNIITIDDFLNKSWFIILNLNRLKLNEINNQLFNKSDVRTSQWMIIDKKHIFYFFYNKANIKTYIKNNKNFIKINEELITLKSDINFYNIINEYNYCDYLLIKNDYLTDEIYFINWILLILFKNNNNINKCIEENFILFDFDKIGKRAKLLNHDLINKLKNIDLINQKNISYIEPIKNFKSYLLINNDIKINLLVKNTISNNSNKNYFVSFTYIDELNITYSINPFSILRTTDNDLNQKLSSLLLLPFTYNSLNILKESINNLNIKGNANLFINISRHPIEFRSFTLLNIINFYLIYLQINNNYSDKNLNTFYKIINDNFNIDNIEKKLEIQFEIIFNKVKCDPILLEKKYGTPITSNFLISAILNNCLFIRKILNNSLIDEFSNILKFNSKFIIPKNETNNFEIKNYNLIEDDIQFNYNTVNIIKKNIDLINRFKKYGNKYYKI